MKRINFLLLLLIPTLGFSQNAIFQKVSEAQLRSVDAPTFELMTDVSDQIASRSISADELTKGLVFEPSLRGMDELIHSNNERILMNVPLPGYDHPVQLDLVAHKLLRDNFILSTPDGYEKYGKSAYYHGIIAGDENSLVAISVFPDHIVGFVSNRNGNFVIGKLKSNQTTHVIYNDKDLVGTPDWECATPDDDKAYAAEMLEWNGSARDVGDCINVYIEIDDDIVSQKGGAVPATNYVTGLFNEVITLYANEQLAMAISEIKAWTTNSPYSSNSSSGMLNDFQDNVGQFNGDLAHLVSYQASGGIAAGFNGICANNPDNSMCFSSISSSYANVPTYSWSVMVTTHEMGHLIGSRHTHACVWNGNNTAIDGCAGSTEGSCSNPGNPSGGGTIMSYCHLTNVGINPANGFGTQPGNVIRNTVANANCLGDCGQQGPTCFDGIQNGQETGVDCGGPDCPACPQPCTDNEVTLNITLDNYPEETSWQVTDANGAIVASGGTYAQQPDGSTVTENICLVDGCYDFTILDTYGDGICCDYGNGSYSLTDASGTVLASGADFESSETTNFCQGNQGPTCTDGIMNGQETGVDCGGPDCPACPTCFDGVQNGQETGVDCGGPDCPTCPTCSDGIQNGDETGVDCGGPDCPDCPTCDDGVLNGQETGVDCGGPDCPACPPSGCQDNEVTLTLILDNYPGETSWTITNASGAILAQGGNYGGLGAGATVSETACLVDGCYDFNIFDSFGDGICCNYGNGSYSLTDASGTVLASGGQFTYDESTNFCQSGNGGPTCGDGVQNGQETGVDCGGPDCPACPGGSTEVMASYFESGWDGWSDGGVDCYRYVGARSYEGNYSIRIRDNSGTSSAMTSSQVNLSPYSSVQVDFAFYAHSMENGEDFWLRFKDNNGWQTVAAFARGTDFNNNTFYTASVILNAADFAFGANNKFRFQCDASGNADHIYIDQVIVTANGSGSMNEGSGLSFIQEQGPVVELEQKETVSLEASQIEMYPNPATDVVALKSNKEIQSIEIVSMNGQRVRVIDTNAFNEEIILSDLQPGIYYIMIQVDGEVIPQKLIKL